MRESWRRKPDKRKQDKEGNSAKRAVSLVSIALLLSAASTLFAATPARAATTVTLHLNAPIVGMAATSDNRGYWTVGSDGGVFSFGDAHFYGSMGGKHLNAPIVGMTAGTDSGGYWMVASDGGVFSFGDAHFYGSMGDKRLNAPIVGIASSSDGEGYWLVASDGGVFAFGNAHFYGSMGGRHLDAPVVSISVDPATGGYWMVGSDGGVFAFHSSFDGSKGGSPLNAPIRAVVSMHTGGGYWLSGETGGVFPFGGAPFEGAIDGILPGADPPSVDTSASRILAVARSQVGQTDPYLYGPVGSGWCAYFVSWVWEHAGIPMPPVPMAYEVGTWALANGGTLLPPTATPQVGDAVLFEPPGSNIAWPDGGGLGYPNIEHVNIVVEVLPGNQIITIGGNESGAVREQGPYSAADASSWWGQAIYGFVQPPGV